LPITGRSPRWEPYGRRRGINGDYFDIQVTGAVTALRPGTATISVTSGGVTGKLPVTVTG
jgi:hypothetical protein